MQYDWLIVGAGLFGSVFANAVHKRGGKALVVDQRAHIGGNIYTEMQQGIPVHRYGAHIFHTDDAEVWAYVNQFATFNRFTNAPMAKYGDELYHLPFSMHTFHDMWGVTTPAQAKEIIDLQRREIQGEPKNLEEQAISMVGRDIYEKLVKGYTEKQWGREATELPAFIIRRLPLRFTYDSSYFNDRFQGIPTGGYTQMIEKMLQGSTVLLNTEFQANHKDLLSQAKRVLYTGTIDGYYGYCYGPLAYRSLRFDTVELPEQNHQGNAVINYTEADVPYTRVIEHKHFEYDNPNITQCPHTVLTYEYPMEWKLGDEPYYPVNDEINTSLLKRYQQLAAQENKVLFGGRLGSYQYQDMDDTIRAALDLSQALL